MPDEAEMLGEGQLHWLASIVADGTATPGDARQLLAEFVRQADAGRVSPRMIEHLRDCIAAYLGVRRPSLLVNPAPPVPVASLDKAFGLIRTKRGQPANDPDDERAAATAVLVERLNGATFEVARDAVSDRRRGAGLPVSSETQVAEAWARHKLDALLWLRLSRLPEVDPKAPSWTEPELAQLREIYAGVPGVVLPGDTPWKGRHVPPENSPNTPS